MTTLTSAHKGGDVLIHRESLQYNMFSGTLIFPAGGAPHNLPQPAGYPAVYDEAAKTFTLVQNDAGLAAADALVIEGPPVAGGVANGAVTPAASPYSGVFGDYNEGVVINSSALPIEFTDGTTITQATLIARLTAIGFKIVTEAPQITTQTQNS